MIDRFTGGVKPAPVPQDSPAPAPDASDTPADNNAGPADSDQAKPN
jgi:hypothetical protein